MVKHQKYLITWRDHFSTEGWFNVNEPKIAGDFTLDSVGFFMGEDKHYYHFARTIGTHSCADMMSILKNQIVKKKVLK